MQAANPSPASGDEGVVRDALSTPRMGTYVLAAGGDLGRAITLYGWNARISAALMLPAHFAEVTTRNAVSEGLTRLYGPNWPRSRSLTRSLPAPTGAFNPRRELQRAAGKQPTTGKIIAELKFAFWQHMFTSRHHDRVWKNQILALFPGSTGVSADGLRTRVHDDLETIRQLRNRVAHHEPVIARDLAADLARMLDLVQLRSSPTAAWIRSMEQVSGLLGTRP